jgi:hypothetical protein
MLNSRRAQSPLNQCLIHSKATSFLDRIPLIQIPKFQTSLLWLATSLGSKVTMSPGQCQQWSPISLSVRKSNWNSNQELIWLHLNVINIMVWTKVHEVFFLNNSDNFHSGYDNGLMGFLVIHITDERRYPSFQQGTAA